jgi:hypothetical protein
VVTFLFHKKNFDGFHKTLSIHTFSDNPFSQCHFSDNFSLVLPQKISFAQSTSSQSQIKSKHTTGQEKRNFRHGKSPKTMKAVTQARKSVCSDHTLSSQIPPASSSPQSRPAAWFPSAKPLIVGTGSPLVSSSHFSN